LTTASTIGHRSHLLVNDAAWAFQVQIRFDSFLNARGMLATHPPPRTYLVMRAYVLHPQRPPPCPRNQPAPITHSLRPPPLPPSPPSRSLYMATTHGDAPRSFIARSNVVLSWLLSIFSSLSRICHSFICGLVDSELPNSARLRKSFWEAGLGGFREEIELLGGLVTGGEENALNHVATLSSPIYMILF